MLLTGADGAVHGEERVSCYVVSCLCSVMLQIPPENIVDFVVDMNVRRGSKWSEAAGAAEGVAGSGRGGGVRQEQPAGSTAGRADANAGP
jgi:hypothetical protein